MNKNTGGFVRAWICFLLGFLMDFFLKEYAQNDLNKTAIVFAPHQDDEVLGCGGTIIKKKLAGARVKIVFMTDGCKSVPWSGTEEELISVRMAEAIEVATSLGLKAEDVSFLNYTDGLLNLHWAEAVCKISGILITEKPQEVFMPYSKDGHGDHTAANQIVRTAVNESGFNITAYEYPVWFWNHWPHVKVGMNHYGRTMFKKSIRYFWPQLKEFNCFVNIEECFGLKRSAFDGYKSQQGVKDFADGTFINLFFQGKELFRRYELNEPVV